MGLVLFSFTVNGFSLNTQSLRKFHSHVLRNQHILSWRSQRAAVSSHFATRIHSSSGSYRCDTFAAAVTNNKVWWGARFFGHILRYVLNFSCGLLCCFLLRILNTFKVIRLNTLLNLVFKRPAGVGLLTVSNHQSVFDDPGLWGAMLPFWKLAPQKLRWSLCTEDIFFSVSCDILYIDCFVEILMKK